MAFPTHIVSAGGIVEDGNGNILLVKAHDDDWVYPGGITEVGENLIDGVIHEIKEESGIDATVSHLISVVSNTAIGVNENQNQYQHRRRMGKKL